MVVVQWSAEAADFGKVSIIPSVPMSVHCPLNRACQCQLSSGAFHGISDLAISGAIACDFGQVLFTIFFLKKAVLLCDLKNFPIQLGANPHSHGVVVKMLAKLPRQSAK